MASPPKYIPHTIPHTWDKNRGKKPICQEVKKSICGE
jgi:hypothetical protein